MNNDKYYKYNKWLILHFGPYIGPYITQFHLDSSGSNRKSILIGNQIIKIWIIQKTRNKSKLSLYKLNNISIEKLNEKDQINFVLNNLSLFEIIIQKENEEICHNGSYLHMVITLCKSINSIGISIGWNQGNLINSLAYVNFSNDTYVNNKQQYLNSTKVSKIAAIQQAFRLSKPKAKKALLVYTKDKNKSVKKGIATKRKKFSSRFSKLNQPKKIVKQT